MAGKRRWLQHFARSLTNGRDPYTVLRVALRGRRRGIELLFERDSPGYDDIPMTLIWERGESLQTALDRLAEIPEDPNAGRAPREAMLPCFEGLENEVPLFVRETFVALTDDGTLGVEQIILEDAEVSDPEIRDHVDWRWKEGSTAASNGSRCRNQCGRSP